MSLALLGPHPDCIANIPLEKARSYLPPSLFSSTYHQQSQDSSRPSPRNLGRLPIRFLSFLKGRKQLDKLVQRILPENIRFKPFSLGCKLVCCAHILGLYPVFASDSEYDYNDEHREEVQGVSTQPNPAQVVSFKSTHCLLHVA